MSAILLLLGRVMSVAQAALAVFSFLKKAGADEIDNKVLKERAKADEKNLNELAKSNEFMARINRDPAYRERMLRLLAEAADRDSSSKKK